MFKQLVLKEHYVFLSSFFLFFDYLFFARVEGGFCHLPTAIEYCLFSIPLYQFLIKLLHWFFYDFPGLFALGKVFVVAQIMLAL